MIQLSRIFGSKCRVKILEKLIIEDAISGDSTSFFIRELCRDIGEQINAVRRELTNLETIGLLVSYEERRKKLYRLNRRSIIYPEMVEIFLKAYDPVDRLEDFFKGRKNIEFIGVAQHLRNVRSLDHVSSIIDLFIIGKVDKVELGAELEKIFFGRRVKYAIVSYEEFTERLTYNDKLIINILSQPDIIVLKDKKNLCAMVEEKKRELSFFRKK